MGRGPPVSGCGVAVAPASRVGPRRGRGIPPDDASAGRRLRPDRDRDVARRGRLGSPSIERLTLGVVGVLSIAFVPLARTKAKRSHQPRPVGRPCGHLWGRGGGVANRAPAAGGEGNGIQPVAVFDDDPERWGGFLDTLPIMGDMENVAPEAAVAFLALREGTGRSSPNSSKGPGDLPHGRRRAGAPRRAQPQRPSARFRGHPRPGDGRRSNAAGAPIVLKRRRLSRGGGADVAAVGAGRGAAGAGDRREDRETPLYGQTSASGFIGRCPELVRCAPWFRMRLPPCSTRPTLIPNSERSGRRSLTSNDHPRITRVGGSCCAR